MRTINKLWILVMVLAAISPIGIILPRLFKSGAPWGEARIVSLWNAPIQDYGNGNFGYIFSAIIGIALIAGIMLVAGKFFKSKKNLFIERSLKSALDFFVEAVFSEEVARSRGLLQSIGPRIKIALLFFLVLVTICVKTITGIAALYLLSLALAVFSGIRISYYFKRVWLFIPAFTLFIAIPAVFTHGLSTAVLFVLRVGTCVSFVVLLTITTRHSELILSLRSLGIPAIFVSILDMMYRYVYMFIRIFEQMHLGLKGRLVGRLKAKAARYWIASRMTFIFRRSLRMSADVYMAMVARGYLNDGK